MKNIGTRRLETERLILRRFKPEDAEKMYENWASNPEVTKYLTWPTHTGVEITKTVLQRWIDQYPEEKFYNWGIELKEIGEVIGSISVVHMEETTESAEIGYCIGQEWWGQGIMPEALSEVMTFLFDEVGANRICACHDTNNPKSGRVMEKAGMKYEGTLRQAGRNNQGIYDVVYHAALKAVAQNNGE